MNVILEKKPADVNIFAGFATFGVIGPIVSEYLLEHLSCERIGEIETTTLEPMVAIHKGEVLKPIELYYNKKYNMVIVRSTNKLEGVEWELADALITLAKELNAWQLISVEGIIDQTNQTDTQLFSFSTGEQTSHKLESLKLQPLQEGIIMGLTAAILAKNEGQIAHTTLFATTHSQLPDSKAAAKIIEVLDRYLGLEIDPKPLLQKAQEVEAQLSVMHETKRETQSELKKRSMSYVG